MRSEIFNNIYKNNVWSGGIFPKSGPGSSIGSTKRISEIMDDFIEKKDCKKILDIGCGDLTWVRHTNFFNKLEYTGMDISNVIVDENKSTFPNKNILLGDIIEGYPEEIGDVDLIILRDILFHTLIGDIMKIFKNIQGRFKYLGVTSSNTNENNDNMDISYFSPRNLRIDPFNLPDPIESISEEWFNRSFNIYSHEQIYG